MTFIFRLGTYNIGPLLLLTHLVRRSLEQLILFPYGKESRMHFTAYLFGYVFYVAASLSIADKPDIPFLWFAGNCIQFFAHRDLFRERTSNKKKPPSTFLFKHINCPHYFAEMLIYLGLTSIGSLPSIACAVFVIVSLSVNWRNHSQWYRRNSKPS
jgi:3-oxo-5-alpha-steroid 4-dehydrogenase 3